MPEWVSIYCPHCRRHTSLKEAPVKYRCSGYDFTTGAIWKKDYDNLLWIGVCNSCREPVLVLNEGDAVYPNTLPSPSDERIPEIIN